MNELYSQLTLYANSLWRRRWYALGTAWLVCLIGWAVVAAMPNVYVSSGRIYVDTANVLAPLMGGRNQVGVDVLSEVRLLQQTLLSRPNLERAVRMVDLDITADTPGDMQILVDSVRGRAQLASSITQEDLFSVSYQDSDPRRARDVVQALITIFIESGLGHHGQGFDNARDFIKQELDNYERQLDNAEQALAKFKLDNADLLPGRSSFLARAQEARVALAQAEIQLKEAMAQRTVLRREIASIEEVLDVGGSSGFGSGPPDSHFVRIIQLEGALEDLLSRYTSDHPDVKTIERRLATLREEQNEGLLNLPLGEEEGQVSNGGSGIGIPNPVYSQTHAQLLQLEATVELLEGRVERLTQTVEAANQKSSQVPVVEAELSRLTRDYDLIRNNYDDFRSRQETARIAQNQAVSGDKVQFRIVDPPKVPAFPTGPNRPLFLTVVLFIGLGAGVGIAMVMVILDDTYSTANSLRDEFGVPVFGTVSNLQSFGERLWSISRIATTVVAGVGIFATYGFLQVVEQNSGLSNAGLFEISPGFLNRALNLVQQTFAGVLAGAGF